MMYERTRKRVYLKFLNVNSTTTVHSASSVEDY